METTVLVPKTKTLDDQAVVLRHNNLIEAHYQITPQEQRLFLWAIEQIQVQSGRSQIVSIDIAQLARYIGLGSHEVYEQMMAVTKRIISRRIELRNIETGELVQANLVSAARYKKGSGRVEVEISQMLLPYILEVKKNYALTDLRYEMKLSSGYAMRIYGILKSRQYRSNIVRFELVQLQAMLGVEEKYARFNNFRERVLATSCEEITRTTDINVTFEVEPAKGDKRKAGFVIFRVATKTEVIVPQIAAMTNDVMELRARMIRAGLKPVDVDRSIDAYATSDRNRIVWHLDEVERKVARGEVKSPTAWLKAGLRADYRPKKTELERNIEARQSAKYMTVGRIKAEQAKDAELDQKNRTRQIVIEKIAATLSEDERARWIEGVERKLASVMKTFWRKNPDLRSVTYASQVVEVAREMGIMEAHAEIAAAQVASTAE